MPQEHDINRRIAEMLLAISDQLTSAIARNSGIDSALEAVGLTHDELELIEEGDTTDLESLARLCSALQVRIVIDPDFHVQVVPVRTEIRFGAHEKLHEQESHSVSYDHRLVISGHKSPTVTAGQKVEQQMPAYAD